MHSPRSLEMPVVTSTPSNGRKPSKDYLEVHEKWGKKEKRWENLENCEDTDGKKHGRNMEETWKTWKHLEKSDGRKWTTRGFHFVHLWNRGVQAISSPHDHQLIAQVKHS